MSIYKDALRGRNHDGTNTRTLTSEEHLTAGTSEKSLMDNKRLERPRNIPGEESGCMEKDMVETLDLENGIRQ